MPRNQAHRPSGPRRPVFNVAAFGLMALVTTALLTGVVGPAAGSGRSGSSAFGVAGLDSGDPTSSLDPASVGALDSEGAVPTATPTPAGTPLPTVSPPTASDGRFPGGLLIADRGNGRLLIVTSAGRIAWSFPGHGSLPPGQSFSADDAFIAPDHRTIVANDEAHQVIDRIDIATRRVVWQYGKYDRPGSGAGFLHTPDDAYPLANGDVVTADIRNCRILEISPAKRVVRQWGRTGVCRHDPPRTFDMPNGDTPLPDGGLLITEIRGSRVVRLDAHGRVVFDVHVPATYPSDAQLDASGAIVVVDYANPGAILRVSPTGHVLWRYRPRSGTGRLDHPSLAVPLANGTIVLNDDFRHRVIVVDPVRGRIVWQYGHTDRPGRRPGYLWVPDGIDVVPVGILPQT
jgi:outer membrane protein assembly factor BamB